MQEDEQTARNEVEKRSVAHPLTIASNHTNSNTNSDSKGIMTMTMTETETETMTGGQ